MQRPRRARVFRIVALPALVAMLAVLTPLVVPSASAAAVFAVTPTTGLVDEQVLSVTLTGATPGSTFVFVQCGSLALAIVGGTHPPDTNPQDGCDQQRNSVLFADAAGNVNGTLGADAVMSTAAGNDDCRTDSCFVALFALAGAPALEVQNISFAASACASPGSCVLPQAWPGTTRSAAPAGAHLDVATPLKKTATGATSAKLSLAAGVAGDLSGPDAITGPYAGHFTPPPPPSVPVSGEGLLRLALAAPGTAWGASPPSAVVVDVAVDGVGSQQLVLFRGKTPFVYAAFTGPLTTGAHTVTVAIDGPRSVTRATPSVTVRDAELAVVAPDNPTYLATAYAPVLYGRSTSALHDTPLITYAGASPVAGGTRLSYTVIWSHEDAGTGFVPFLLDGTWGRMTDIENAMSFTVASDGSVHDATYLWGGQPPDYPDTQSAISETNVAFNGAFDGHHPILRVATGNNDFSDTGTTAFRFQSPPVAPPAAGQPRETVMDAHPWTYLVMGEEVNRWYTNVTTDPSSPEAGDARQYAYVQLSTSGTGVSAIAVEVQLAGSSKWYASDFASGYPLTGTGTARTTVKLPMKWSKHAVTGLRLRVLPASAAASVVVHSISLRHLQSDATLATVALPPVQVVAGPAAAALSFTWLIRPDGTGPGTVTH